MDGKDTVVVGCPGTGKTTFLAKLIAEYRAQHPRPVVFCSHTRAAAKAALDKSIDNDPGVQVQTIHSFCFRHLNMSKAQVPDWRQLSEFCSSVGAPMGRNEGEEDIGNDIGDDYLSMVALATARLCSPAEIYNGSPRRDGGLQHFLSFCTSYAKWKDTYGFIDFSDMVLRALKIERFGDMGLLVVDEAQDLTPLQWKVIERILVATPGCQVVIAGDSDQAINSWAGADPLGMHKFEETRGAERIVLPQSYRVPGVIHGLAEDIIDRAAHKVNRTYAPRSGSVGSYVRCSDVSDLKPWGRDTLILYADKFQRREVERELIECATGYTAISGSPAPLDNRVGRAIMAAYTDTPDEGVIKKALNERGRRTVDSVGMEPILKALRRSDFCHLSMPPHLYDYYYRVPKIHPAIRISTIHGAKGLEADDVHLILGRSTAAAEQDWIDPDQSHRLMYVGATRTKNRLFTYETGQNDYDFPIERHDIRRTA